MSGHEGTHRVAVIGAGIAGLTAAKLLSEGGSDVVVFDKARGPGGRTSTRRKADDAFDHGAQYFTCHSHAFQKLVDDWQRRGIVAPWRARVRELAGGHCARREDDGICYVGVPKMSVLARDLADGLSLKCGERIIRVEANAGSFSLRSAEGREAAGFDALIVATPAPQAVPLLSLAPHLAKLADSIEMQPCHALMVTFREPLGVDFDAVRSDGPVSWAARNASKPGRPGAESWVLHTDPGWSADRLTDPPESISEALLHSFAERLELTLPETSVRMVHLWRLARPMAALGQASLWDAKARVGVCGDWMQGTRVEDAYLSGADLAQSIGESPGLGCGGAQTRISVQV